MKKNFIFEDVDNLDVFKNSESETDFYGMNREALNEKIEIIRKYNNVKASIPNEFTIKACHIRFAGSKNPYTDIYRPVHEEIVDFPVKRIEGVWMQVIDPLK
jgi:hypothetical protein